MPLLRTILVSLTLLLGLHAGLESSCCFAEDKPDVVSTASPEKDDPPETLTPSPAPTPPSTLSGYDPIRRAKNVSIALLHTWDLMLDASSRMFLWFWWGVFIGGFLGMATGILLWWAGLKFGFFAIPPRWWRWMRHIVPLFLTFSLILTGIYGGIFAGTGYRFKRAILEDRVLDRIVVSIGAAVIMDANDYELKAQVVEDQMAQVAKDAPQLKKMAEKDFLDAKQKAEQIIPWYIRYLISFSEVDKYVDGQLSKQLAEVDPRVLVGLYVFDGDLKKYREAHPDAPPVLIALSVAMDNAQRRAVDVYTTFCIGQVLMALLAGLICFVFAIGFLWLLRLIFKGKPEAQTPELTTAAPIQTAK